MRQGRVNCNGTNAGLITEDETGYTFVYLRDYLLRDDSQPVSLTLPLREEPYHNVVMFSFFDGLIPEGWMLNIAEQQNVTGRLTATTVWDCYSHAVVTV